MTGNVTFFLAKIYLSICSNTYVPEVLNVHVNEINKKNLLFLGFFLSSEKLTFEKAYVIFLILS